MNDFFAVNAILSMFCKNYMELKKGLPIRPSEMGVLNIIAATPGPHTSVMLAEMLDVSKSMITAHLTVLAQKGYVIKQQSKDDKRVFYILLTDKARDLVEVAKADLDGRLEQLKQRMGQQEFDTLVRLAKKANAVLETEQAREKRKDVYDGSER